MYCAAFEDRSGDNCTNITLVSGSSPQNARCTDAVRDDCDNCEPPAYACIDSVTVSVSAGCGGTFLVDNRSVEFGSRRGSTPQALRQYCCFFSDARENSIGRQVVESFSQSRAPICRNCSQSCSQVCSNPGQRLPRSGRNHADQIQRPDFGPRI